MKDSKDSHLYREFLALFSELKRVTGGDPAAIERCIGTDSDIRRHANRVWASKSIIDYINQIYGKSLVAPENPDFITTWREYESLYEPRIGALIIKEIKIDFLVDPESDKSLALKRNFKDEWEWADAQAEEAADMILAAIKFSSDHFRSAEPYDDEIALIYSSTSEGLERLDQFLRSTGIDIQGCIRRRALIPFTLIPSQISNRFGVSDRFNLIKNLEAAQTSFLHGVNAAAFALMRSVLESTITNEYSATGEGLGEKISNMNESILLNNGLSKQRLKRLKEYSDGILHLNPTKFSSLERLDQWEIEREGNSFLVALRTLIEGAPR